MTPIEKRLIVFAQWVISELREHLGSDLDGGDAQDKLEELGLLVRVPVDAPCGEYCHCAEYDDEFPTECLRLVDGVKP